MATEVLSNLTSEVLSNLPSEVLSNINKIQATDPWIKLCNFPANDATAFWAMLTFATAAVTYQFRNDDNTKFIDAGSDPTYLRKIDWHQYHWEGFLWFGGVISANIVADYLVVGSGSGGSVIARRLAESCKFTVVTFESGGPPPDVSEVWINSFYPLTFIFDNYSD